MTGTTEVSAENMVEANRALIEASVMPGKVVKSLMGFCAKPRPQGMGDRTSLYKLDHVRVSGNCIEANDGAKALRLHLLDDLGDAGLVALPAIKGGDVRLARVGGTVAIETGKVGTWKYSAMPDPEHIGLCPVLPDKGWPDYNSIWPDAGEKPTASVCLDARQLIAACNLAIAMHRSDDEAPLTIEIYTKQRPVRLRSIKKDIGEADMLIAPFVEDE